MLHSARLQRKSVGARSRFAQRVGADGVRCQPGKIILLLLRRAPVHQRVDDKRVMHINEQRHRRVDLGKRLHGQNGVKECAAAAAEFLGNLNAHQAQRKQLAQERQIHLLIFIHAAAPGRKTSSWVNWCTESRKSVSSSLNCVTGARGRERVQERLPPGIRSVLSQIVSR